MKPLGRIVAALVFVAMAGPASAHSVFGITGFFGGLLHLLVVPSHLMAVAALGLLIGQQRWGSGVSIVYAVAVCAGLGTIALGTVPTFAEETLLTAVAAVGLLVALAWPVLWAVGAGLAAIAGFALALDSPPEAITLREANLTLLGTALSAVVLLLAVTAAVSHLQRDWQRIGVRILGSWIAASAILVLALRLVR
jgi:hydrogenase/urease accessory protein HupE